MERFVTAQTRRVRLYFYHALRFQNLKSCFFVFLFPS